MHGLKLFVADLLRVVVWHLDPPKVEHPEHEPRS